MASRKTKLPKTEDSLLPGTLTQEFIRDVNNVLTTLDTDLKAKYLKVYWLTKFCELDAKSASERRHKAITKWLSVEQSNSVTNQRLTSSADQFLFYERKSFRSVLDKAREIVHQVVGDTPSLDLFHGGFSGGASTSKSRSQGHPALKFLDKADTTRPAYPVFLQLIAGTRWADHMNDHGLDPRFVHGNVLFTVPKNADIDRVACKEPDLNMFCQKSLGNQIRWALRRVGINLNDQSINAELARRGSVDGSLATLDLSSASDSVTIELVRRLMPFDWFYYLELFRSPITEIDGSEHVNEMFSSMGNGYTFELESLLFYALARAAAYVLGVRGKISVYGDDIIVPTELYEPTVRLLAFCGFKSNESKSFHEGPFRESCGAYWHSGIDVKPFFLRRPLTRISDLILILNQLTQWSSLLGVMDPVWADLFREYRKYVPTYLWGGQDLTSRLSLVTGDAPRKELKPVATMRFHRHVGGLLMWLFISYHRIGFVDDPLIVIGTSDTGLYRLRKNRQPYNTDLPFMGVSMS